VQSEFFVIKPKFHDSVKSRWLKKNGSHASNTKKILMSQKLMSKSKQMTMADSNFLKTGGSIDSFEFFARDSSQQFKSNCSSQDQVVEDNKKLIIMSTVNMKISSD
jgi:hypothetical protein